MGLRQVKPGGGGDRTEGESADCYGGGGSVSRYHLVSHTFRHNNSRATRESHRALEPRLESPRTSNLGTEQYRGRLRKLTQDDVSPALWSDDWGPGVASGPSFTAQTASCSCPGGGGGWKATCPWLSGRKGGTGGWDGRVERTGGVAGLGEGGGKGRGTEGDTRTACSGLVKDARPRVAS